MSEKFEKLFEHRPNLRHSKQLRLCRWCPRLHPGRRPVPQPGPSFSEQKSPACGLPWQLVVSTQVRCAQLRAKPASREGDLEKQWQASAEGLRKGLQKGLVERVHSHVMVRRNTTSEMSETPKRAGRLMFWTMTRVVVAQRSFCQETSNAPAQEILMSLLQLLMDTLDRLLKQILTPSPRQSRVVRPMLGDKVAWLILAPFLLAASPSLPITTFV